MLLDGINGENFCFKGLIHLLKSRYYYFELEIFKNNIGLSMKV